MPLTLKISDELQTKLGIATVDHAISLLELSAANLDRATTSEQRAMIAETKLETFESRISAIESRQLIREADGKLFVTLNGAEIDLTAHIDKVAGLAAGRETLAAIAKIGGSALTTKEKQPDVIDEKLKTFAEIVAAKVTSGSTKAEAIKWAIANHSKEYAEARKTNIKL